MITNLSEGQEYDVQVVALSIDDQQAVSDKVRAVFPGYKSLGAVSTGVIVGFAFLGATFVVFYYIRRKWCQSYHQPNIKN
ncbi:unnamed protein product [Acanthoscelides obtectus]|uniref:Uncharacterized protein n=1 Tax=Acanthoscelides obtectus TaxID=200917 RepID=A0A9P0Q3F7_ACAOB|nr:unnamed protein product [Acanthoscelides obtectus]CAK1643507.1 hypothetical protein AOBTE_LOCUS13555 [Acanthoscelides obtectus]